MIWSLCMNCCIRSFERTRAVERIHEFKDWPLVSVAMLMCAQVRYSLGLLWGRALHSLSRAPASGMLTPFVYSKKAGTVLTVTTYWYEYSFGAEGQGMLPKWGDRELFIEVACNLQANIKENCILFMWWVSLLLHIAPWGSPWGSQLIKNLNIAFWVMGEGHPL